MILKPYLEVIIAALIWSTTGLFLKYIDLPVSTTTFARVLVPTTILLSYYLIKRKPVFSGMSKITFLASTLNAIRLSLVFLAFSLTTISNTIIIFYCWPLFAALFARLLLSEKIGSKHTAYLLLPFLGVIFIYSDISLTLQSNDFLGVSASLMSAIIYALSLILFKREKKRYSVQKTVFYQNLVGCFFFLPLFLAFGRYPTLTESIYLIIWAFFIGVVGYYLFFSALRTIKSATASGLTYLDPFFAVILGAIFLKEVLTLKVLIGGLCILVSAFKLRKVSLDGSH